MHKFRGGDLHSGSKTGPVVKDRKKAIAIMLSEKKKAGEGKKEYKGIEPSPMFKKKHGMK